MSIVLFAKQVGAAADLNRFQPQWKAFDDAFEKLQFGRVAKHARDRLRGRGIEIVSRDERHDCEAKRAKAALTQVAKSEALPRNIPEIATQETAALRTLVRKSDRDVREAVRTIDENAKRKRAALELVDDKEHTPVVPVSATSSTPAPSAPSPTEKAERDKVRQSEIKKIGDEARRDIAAVQATHERWKSAVNCEYGETRERETLQKLGEKRKRADIVHAPQSEDKRPLYIVMGRVRRSDGHVSWDPDDCREFKTPREGELGKTHASWSICGRLDATMDSRIVEIKNRTRRFFDRVPMYERAQLECYMRIKDADDCLLVQQLGGDIRESDVERDDSLWYSMIMPALVQFVATLAWLQADEQFGEQEQWVEADQLTGAGDRPGASASACAKEALFDKWLGKHERVFDRVQTQAAVECNRRRRRCAANEQREERVKSKE